MGTLHLASIEGLQRTKFVPNFMKDRDVVVAHETKRRRELRNEESLRNSEIEIESK